MFKNFAALSEGMKVKTPKTLVVAAAEDSHTLEAVYASGMPHILVGDEEKIKRLSDELGFEPWNIWNTRNQEESAKLAVSLARENGGVLMKGLLETAVLLSAVLDKETGIRHAKTLSHIAVLEVPGYHKLAAVTDGGMCAHPTFEQKADIIQNAADFMVKLGVNSPKIAVLSASEAVSVKVPESVDASLLAEKFTNSGFTVEGPLSFDIAVDKEAAEVKGFKSRISGDVDILVVPNVTAGNILCKSLTNWAGAKLAGAVLGAKSPIVLVSRGASAEEKALSIAICCG